LGVGLIHTNDKSINTNNSTPALWQVVWKLHCGKTGLAIRNVVADFSIYSIAAEMYAEDLVKIGKAFDVEVRFNGQFWMNGGWKSRVIEVNMKDGVKVKVTNT
jgi:hypothetical protein